MKKILCLLLIFLCLTGCGLNKKETENKSSQKKSQTKEITNQEETKYLDGTYFASGSGITGYDDYFTFKKDKTFFKQTNFCSGYKHFEGTYELTTYKNKSAIKLVVNDHEDLPVYLKYEDDIISNFRDIDYPEEYNEILDVIISCGYEDWQKGDPSSIIYHDEIVLSVEPY